MSVETFIGWRYLKAKRRQAFISLITLISLAGVSLGVAALIVVIAVMNGFEEDLKDKILGVNAHIVVVRKGAPLEDYRDLAKQVSGMEGVTRAEPVILSQVMIRGFAGTTGGSLRGIDLTGKRKDDPTWGMLRDGDWASLRDKEPTAVLGLEMARELGVMVGDTVKIVSPIGRITPLGSRVPSQDIFKVGGLFESKLYEFDASMAFVSLETAQNFLNLGPSVTGLEVRVKDVYRADAVREAILKNLGSGYQAKDWMQLNRNLFSALKLEKVAMFIVLTLTILVAAFNIVSTLNMVVLEKNREIAVLISLGATRWLIMKIFMFQGLVVGVVGTILGLVFGVTLSLLLARYEFIKLPESVYYITTLPVKMESLDVAMILGASLVICFVATLYPAWQAARLNPVEALRYE